MNKKRRLLRTHPVVIFILCLFMVSISCKIGSFVTSDESLDSTTVRHSVPGTADPPRIKATHTPTLPVPTLTPSELDLFIELQPLIGQAIYLQQYEENCTDALPLWDQVLEQIPGYSKGYYYRGSCYYRLGSTNQFLKSTAQEYYSLGYADALKGLELGPESGHYYDLMYFLAGRIGILDDIRINRLEWFNKAIDSHLKAIDMGLRDPWGNRGIGLELIENQRCQEALDYFSELESIMNPEYLPSAGIHTGYAESYLCLRKYDLALDHINQALEISPSSEREFTKALIELNAGRLYNAMEILDKSIEEKPNYQGRRYYLRAVIHYELGNTELALQDLILGQGNTWGSYLEQSYVLGRIALDEGMIDEGLEMLQLAEASLFTHEVPRIYDQTMAILEQYDTEILYPTPISDGQPTPTPILPYSDQAYFTPTPATDHTRFTLANYSGTGMIFFEDGARPGISFRPNRRVEIIDVESITINIDPGDDPPDELLISLECVTTDGKWNTPEHPMEFQELFIGDNLVEDIDNCVDDMGFMNLLFWNIGGKPIALKNISVEIDAEYTN